MSDLLIRLWGWERVFPCDEDKPEGSLYLEAADRIEELEAKLARAVEALEFYADRTYDGYYVGVTDYGLSTACGPIVLDGGDTARAAIAELKGEEQ